ncbi:DUF4393 domain-containing protein [Thiohalorhabdus methylotrophus]|uniref:DUF4393 domain-containing protein n=1 Tax=Thiohalorhabdus methylotrophus TaxID=3242694 RepID=A0ABV4TT23_9GAMM
MSEDGGEEEGKTWPDLADQAYQDSLKPAVQELGKSLETLTKAVNAALSPVGALVWGYEQCQDFINQKVAEKLSRTDERNITTPAPNVAGPVLEALRYSGYQEDLQDLFANLLANAMDAEEMRNAHPAFVEVLKSMTSDEAKIMKIFGENLNRFYPVIDLKLIDNNEKGFKYLYRNLSTAGDRAGCECPDLTPSYLNNLQRMGLMEINSGEVNRKEVYKNIEKKSLVEELFNYYENSEDYDVEIDRKSVILSEFGKQFALACVIEKGSEVEV